MPTQHLKQASFYADVFVNQLFFISKDPSFPFRGLPTFFPGGPKALQ